MSLKNEIRWTLFLIKYKILSVRSAAAHKLAKIAISLNEKHLCPAILTSFLVDHYGRIVGRKGELALWSDDFVKEVCR